MLDNPKPENHFAGPLLGFHIRGWEADSNRFLLSNYLFVLSSEPPNFWGVGLKPPQPLLHNDATDLVSESQVKTRFELVIEPVQTINQQNLIFIQMFIFLSQKMSKNDDIKNFFLLVSGILFENVNSLISFFCVVNEKNNKSIL